MRKKRRNKIGIFQKTVFPKKKVAVSVMLFAVLMQLVMQPMSVHASIQSASGKNAVPEVSYHGKEQSITFKNTDGTDLFQGFKNLMPGDVREQEMILMLVVLLAVFAVVFLARRMAMKHAWKVAIAAGTVIYLVLMMAGYMMLHLEIGILWILIGTLISAAVAFLLEQLFFNLDYRKIENIQFEDNDYYYYVEAVPKRYRNDEDSQEMEAGRIDRKGREHHDGHETIHS